MGRSAHRAHFSTAANVTNAAEVTILLQRPGGEFCARSAHTKKAPCPPEARQRLHDAGLRRRGVRARGGCRR
jgi:hypothetical protein